jgi:hypothetical protein
MSELKLRPPVPDIFPQAVKPCATGRVFFPCVRDGGGKEAPRRGWAWESVMVRAWGAGVLCLYEEASGVKPLLQEMRFTNPTCNPRGRLAVLAWPI